MIKEKLSRQTRIQVIITILILLGIRIGSNIPVPFINREMIKQLLSQSRFGLMNILSGGSLEKMAIFALGVAPYITGTIIVQLLSVLSPRIKEIQDNEKEKHEKILFIANIAISFVTALGTAMTFGKSGYLDNTFIKVMTVTLVMTAGSVILVLLGKLIDKKGIENGISLILAAGILATMPASFASLFKTLIHGKNIGRQCITAAAIVLVTAAITAFVVVLNESKKKVPVTYSGKMVGNRQRVGQDTFIPIPANPAGVVPVIFTAQILALPLLIFKGGWTRYLSQSNWFDPQAIKYTLGFILYAIMTIGFAYFYVSITFDVNQIAHNLKQSGGMVPGIRPGKPTADYFKKLLKPTIFKGALALLAVQVIPMLIAGIWGVNVSFGGTSILIVVGVILETRQRLKAKKANTAYRSFLAS